MANKIQKNLSPFGLAALNLDQDFLDLEQLSGQIQRLEIDTDYGLERSQELFSKFAETAQGIGERVQEMARTLEEMRARTANAAQVVEERAKEIQQRRQETSQILERYKALGEKIQGINAELTKFKKPMGQIPSIEEKNELIEKSYEVDAKLVPFIAEARKLKEEAHAFKMRGLEKTVDSLAQSLEAARRKLSWAKTELN